MDACLFGWSFVQLAQMQTQAGTPWPRVPQSPVQSEQGGATNAATDEKVGGVGTPHMLHWLGQSWSISPQQAVYLTRPGSRLLLLTVIRQAWPAKDSAQTYPDNSEGKERPVRLTNTISQMLGNEMKFAVREPLGLRLWQFVSAVMFTGVAIMALAFPDQLYDAVFDEGSVSNKTSIRLYGGALLSISLIMWNSMYTSEKVIIRWSLLTEACYFGVQFIVTTITLIENGIISNGAAILLSSRALFILISFYYYYQVGRRPKKL